jgi:hypothetical protein
VERRGNNGSRPATRPRKSGILKLGRGATSVGLVACLPGMSGTGGMSGGSEGAQDKKLSFS